MNVKQFWQLFWFLTMTIGMLGSASAQGSLNLRLPNRLGATSLVIEHNSSVPVPTALGTWRAYDHCYATAVVRMTHSAHPGGDLGGRLNQDNGGHGGRCYLDPEKTFYGLVLGLINSQSADTLVVALGKRWAIVAFETEFLERVHIPIDRLTLYVGGEGGGINYGRRFGRKAVWALFAFPNIAGSIHIGKLEITATQTFLPGKIKLWGQVIEVPPHLAGNYQLSPLPYEGSVSGLGERPRFRPSIYLNYRF